MTEWRIYQGNSEPHDAIIHLPEPPPWRSFSKTAKPRAKFQVDEKEIELVNAALYLRRPLLVKGQPGTGKSSLAHAVAHELKLGPILVWPITSRSTVQDALYRYDAIGRLQDANLHKSEINVAEVEKRIGQFIRLGPLGTALLPSERPRVLLIDEIDKSDIDLPNDLLYIFEEGHYEIAELARLADTTPQVEIFPHDSQNKVLIERGQVHCTQFPFVVITSNAERELPPAFLRRCLTLEIEEPNSTKLARIVRAHFGEKTSSSIEDLLKNFVSRRDDRGYIATDQLLNAIYLLNQHVDLSKELAVVDDEADSDAKTALIDFILQSLSTREGL